MRVMTADTRRAAAGPAPPDPRAAALSGALSGALASLATHPLDVVRTKLAVQRARPAASGPLYRGTVDTLRRIATEEGMAGLFRGLAPAVASHAPAAAIFFSTYSFVRDSAPDAFAPPFVPPDLARSSVAAGVAWAGTCVVLNPLFVLKTKQQAQLVRARPDAPLKYVGLLSSLRVVIAEQGVRGLYAGTLAAMASSPGAMLQMPLYEYLKRAPLPFLPPRARTPDGATEAGDGGGQEEPSHARIAMASASSASLVGIIMYPMEVVRLRLQAQDPAKRSGGGAKHHHGQQMTHYHGIVDCFRKILASEGMRSFYRGLGTGLIRTVPQSAIGLGCYETMLRIATSVFDLVER